MKSSLLHPSYYPDTLFNDVALLGLAAPADLSRLAGRLWYDDFTTKSGEVGVGYYYTTKAGEVRVG